MVLISSAYFPILLATVLSFFSICALSFSLIDIQPFSREAVRALASSVESFRPIVQAPLQTVQAVQLVSQLPTGLGLPLENELCCRRRLEEGGNVLNHPARPE